MSQGVPTGRALSQIANPEALQLDRTGRSEKYLYEHIPIASADSVMRTLDSTTDTRYIVDGIDYDDMGKGNARVNRVMKRINYNGSWYIAEVDASNNGGTKSRMREWPFVLDTYADVLMDSGIATDTFKYDGDTFLHIRAMRSRHYDGTSTVRQYASEPTATVATPGSGTAITVGRNTDSELFYGFHTAGGITHKHIIYQKIFGSWTDAKTFADGSSEFFWDGRAPKSSKFGTVDLYSDGKWLAKRVVYVP